VRKHQRADRHRTIRGDSNGTKHRHTSDTALYDAAFTVRSHAHAHRRRPRRLFRHRPAPSPHTLHSISICPDAAPPCQRLFRYFSHLIIFHYFIAAFLITLTLLHDPAISFSSLTRSAFSFVTSSARRAAVCGAVQCKKKEAARAGDMRVRRASPAARPGSRRVVFTLSFIRRLMRLQSRRGVPHPENRLFETPPTSHQHHGAAVQGYLMCRLLRHNHAKAGTTMIMITIRCPHRFSPTHHRCRR